VRGQRIVFAITQTASADGHEGALSSCSDPVSLARQSRSHSTNLRLTHRASTIAIARVLPGPLPVTGRCGPMLDCSRRGSAGSTFPRASSKGHPTQIPGHIVPGRRLPCEWGRALRPGLGGHFSRTTSAQNMVVGSSGPCPCNPGSCRGPDTTKSRAESVSGCDRAPEFAMIAGQAA